jgi:hypothetical protein
MSVMVQVVIHAEDIATADGGAPPAQEASIMGDEALNEAGAGAPIGATEVLGHEGVVWPQVERAVADRCHDAVSVDLPGTDHLRSIVEVEAGISCVVRQVRHEKDDWPAKQRGLEDRRRVVGDQDVGRQEDVVHVLGGVDDEVEAGAVDERWVQVGMALQHEDVARREGRAHAGGIERRRGNLADAAAPEGGRVGDHAAVAEVGIRLEHPEPGGSHGRFIEEQVGQRGAGREDSIDGRPKRA